MIVGSRRKQRGALRTHDSAGETPPQTEHKGEVGGSQKTAAASDRASRWRTGRGTQRDVRTSIHWDENTLEEIWPQIESADSTAAHRSAASTRGLGSIEPC